MRIQLVIFSILAIVLVGEWGASAVEPPVAEQAVLTIKAARHQGFIRVVLSGDEPLVKGTSAVITEAKSIRVTAKVPAQDNQKTENQLKGRPALLIRTEKAPLKQDMPIEIFKTVTVTAKPDGCVIDIPKLEEIKVSRLPNPSRLVIDARISAQSKGESAEVLTVKAPVEQVPFRYFLFDPGHGGYDYGIRGSHFVEKELALSFAKDLAALFTKGGKEALLTRRSDQILSLNERVLSAMRRPPEVFISIHVSMGREPRIYSPAEPAEGSVIVLTAYEQKRREQSRAVARAVAAGLQKEFGFQPVVEHMPLELLSRMPVAAILIELPNPDLLAYDKKTRERLLLAIIRGLASAPREERPPLPLPAPAKTEKPVSAPVVKPEKQLRKDDEPAASAVKPDKPVEATMPKAPAGMTQPQVSPEKVGGN